MIKHSDNVIVLALRDWMLNHQDDTGCRMAADQLGQLGATSILLEMLDGPLTSRCALEVAAALGNHADASHLAYLARHRAEFHQVAAMLDVAIEDIVESEGACSCGLCRDALGDQPGLDGSFGPVVPPSDPQSHLRN